MIDYFNDEPMKYWAPTSTMSAEAKRARLEQMAGSGQYIWSQKYDGNWSRAVITADRAALQTRGISKTTGIFVLPAVEELVKFKVILPSSCMIS